MREWTMLILINSTFIESSILSDPRVVLNLIQSQSLGGVVGQDVRNKISGFSRHEVRELQVNPLDSVISGLVVFSFEGRVANKELITENAQTPDVHPVVMGQVIHHLRRQVVESPTQSLSPVVGSMDTPSEVSYFDGTL